MIWFNLPALGLTTLPRFTLYQAPPLSRRKDTPVVPEEKFQQFLNEANKPQ